MLIGIDASRAGKKIKTGTEWYSYQLILQLTKIDYKNNYILYTKSDAINFPSHLPANFKIKILHWPFLFFWTHFRLSLEMLINPPDILFVPAHSVPLIHRNRTIVTIHDLGFLHFPQLYSLISRLYHRFSAWWSIKFAKKIITISNFTKQDILKNFNIDKNKIEVIPLGINPSDFYQTDNKFNLTDFKIKNKYFLYIGRIEKKKNIEFLLHTWQEFLKTNRNFSLVLAGKDGYGSQEIKNKFKNLENVIFLGYVSEQEKIFLLKNCFAFIFPSLFEGFGLPILEALAAGSLVLCANNTSLPEVGGDIVWYFDPKDQISLLKLLQKAINLNPQEFVKYQSQAHERVKLFTWEITAKKTLWFLNQSKSL